MLCSYVRNYYNIAIIVHKFFDVYVVTHVMPSLCMIELIRNIL